VRRGPGIGSRHHLRTATRGRERCRRCGRGRPEARPAPARRARPHRL